MLQLAALAGAAAAAYGGTAAWLWDRWLVDPYYSHGPLVPLVSAALLWTRRSSLRLGSGRTTLAAAALLASGAILLVGTRLRFEMLGALALVGTLLALASALGGGALLRACAFPILYLLFAVPLPLFFVQALSLPLQRLSSAAAGTLLQWLGADCVRNGVHLQFPGFALTIADACSGLRSLVTVLALAALFAGVLPASRSRRLLLVCAAVPLAIVANVLRIAATAVVGLALSGEAAAGFFEQGSGVIFFLLVTLGLCALLPPSRPRAPDARRDPSPMGSLLPPLLALAAVAASSLGLRHSLPRPRIWDLREWAPSVQGWNAARLTPEGQSLDRSGAALRFSRPGVPPVDVLVRIEDDPRYLHTPELCSTAAGWLPDRRRTAGIPFGGHPVELTVLQASRGRDRVLVASWAMVDGRAVDDTLDYHLEVVRARWRRGRCTVLQVEAATGFRNEAESEAMERLTSVLKGIHEEVGRLLAR